MNSKDWLSVLRALGIGIVALACVVCPPLIIVVGIVVALSWLVPKP